MWVLLIRQDIAFNRFISSSHANATEMVYRLKLLLKHPLLVSL